MSDNYWGDKNTSIWILQGKTAEKYTYTNFAMETAFEIQVSDCNRNYGMEYK